MSEATFAQLEQAIRAHVADEAEGETRVLTDWYLITAAVGTELGVTNYLHVCSESPSHSLIGLTAVAYRRMSSHVDDTDE